MPVVGIPTHMLLQRIATALGRDELVEHLQHLGCDVEGYATLRRFGCLRCDNILEITATENPPVTCDRCGVDYREQPAARNELGTTEVVRMELLAVRPDMFDPGGLARVLRHFLGESDQPAHYALEPAQLRVRVDAAMSAPSSYRPHIACGVVRDLVLDEDAIKTLMKLQENLHWALGRDRKHASIGVYDLDTLASGALEYRGVGPDELRFVPLGYDPARAESALTPRQILEQHPKGKAYAHLLENFARYPLLCDSAGQVLSMPPIINSEQTRVTRQTRNFFIDVTGTDRRLIERALNILSTSLLELRGASEDSAGVGTRLEQVVIAYPEGEHLTPDLAPQRVELDPRAAAELIGAALEPSEISRCLRRMGHGVDMPPTAHAPLRVEVPAYRNDILHPVDLIEDVAIAYGYHNLKPALVPTLTVGQELPLERYANVVRQALCGLGCFEVLTLILSSGEQQYDAMRIPRRDDHVVIANPISAAQTIIRTSLIPGLLDTLGINTDHDMPQRIFEVGNISLLDPSAETGARERRLVAAALAGPRVDYAEARSSCEALLRELGWELAVMADQSPCFIAGRGAKIIARRAEQQREVGRLGELHPAVLEHFNLVQPAATFEVDLSALISDIIEV